MRSLNETDKHLEGVELKKETTISELNDAPTIYEWSRVAEPYTPFKVMAALSGLVFIFSGVMLSLNYQSLIPILICSSIGFALAGFVRYLWFADKHYHYQLTPIGIRYTIQDAIPETAYQVVRAFAWVGVFVCILAVGVLGPLAFVGAGGMAFLAFGMTNFSSKIDEDWFYFVDNYEINILRKSNVFSMKNHPIKLYEFGYVYCEPGKLDEMLNRILPYLNNYTIKEIKSYRDL